jgi:aldose 1-epimerase
MATPSGDQFRLVAHDQELTVVEVGGGIRNYRAGGVDILDGYAEEEMCDGGRGQLLAPWPNRLQDGVFEWAGQQLQTSLSEPENHNAIHGLVRWSAWRAAGTASDRVRLEHRLHPQPGWPWTLDFAVEYQLGDRGLTVRTVVENPGDVPCPLGVGWHPYISGPVGEMVLTVPAQAAYISDERGLPIRSFTVEGTKMDFRSGRDVVTESRLDNAFTGLQPDSDGRAVVDVALRDRSVKLWMDEHYTHVMIYRPDGGHSLAVEPMTCAPNMLKTGDGLIVLKAGATFDATWGLETFRSS